MADYAANASRSVGQAGAGRMVSSALDTPTNSRIRDGVTALETQVHELHGLISSLESRLETALAPEPQDESNAKSLGTIPYQQLTDRIHSLSHAVQDAQARLRQLLSRIEI